MGREELPIADWDQQAIGTLQHRVRALDAPELRTLLDHERDHADRPAVKNLLVGRLRRLDDGAEPTAGGQPPHSDAPAGARSGPPVTPATSAPPSHAPPHGTPQQPGSGFRDGP
ncbi:hypothetical protein [Streptomyces sp. NBRC 109706]|uniref:hypothetical protein n=1 Tax=Streptomyces sp. NBRC 109706 TaxID=1550035 RepID=UPI000783DC95|nr:hypothetical protein [Streptomyces sp. NBRC 109706]